jgi:hypothetical protein
VLVIVTEAVAVCPGTIVTVCEPVACAVPVPCWFGYAVAVSVTGPAGRPVNVAVEGFEGAPSLPTINWLPSVCEPLVTTARML